MLLITVYHVNTYECNATHLEVEYSSQVFEFWNYCPIFTDFFRILPHFGHTSMERIWQILGPILKFMAFYDFSLPLTPNGQKQQK